MGTRWPLALAVLLAACAAGKGADRVDGSDEARLIRAIAGFATLAGEADDPRVVAAIGAVPRAAFVLPEWRDAAAQDRALPICHGQTISQPTIVALMTQLLRPRPGHRMLEVGTGSGYQAAVLSKLVAQLFSIEIVPELAAGAAERLARLGHANVQVRAGDGQAGWPEEAPFDGIIVTAAAPAIPAPLVAQLKPGGRMVIPVGPRDGVQVLKVVEKGADGQVTETPILDVRFVPLTGEGACGPR